MERKDMPRVILSAMLVIVALSVLAAGISNASSVPAYYWNNSTNYWQFCHLYPNAPQCQQGYQQNYPYQNYPYQNQCPYQQNQNCVQYQYEYFTQTITSTSTVTSIQTQTTTMYSTVTVTSTSTSVPAPVVVTQTQMQQVTQTVRDTSVEEMYGDIIVALIIVLVVALALVGLSTYHIVRKPRLS